MLYIPSRSTGPDGSPRIHATHGTTASTTEDDKTPTTTGPQTGF